jgi:glycosyltransferase involved in cell wall biosynthesis
MMQFSDQQPLVSVCMPAYNAAAYIGAAIESVLTQTYPHVELVIVNDGSSDRTGDILQEYAGNPRVRVINSKRGGQCAAANLAYRHSKGQLIKFFDADDVLNKEHLAIQVGRLLADPDSIAAGRVRRFYNNDISGALHEPLATWQDMKPLDWLLIDNGKGLAMMQCAMFLIPRQLLESAGLWNESLSQINDFEFFPRVLLKANRVLFTEEAVVYYRSGIADSLSGNLSQPKLISAFTALQLTTTLLLQYEDSDRVRSVLFLLWDMWKHIFYLDDMNLYRRTLLQMKQLGPYSNRYKGKDSLIVKLIGWKTEKRIKRLIKRP